MLLIDKSAFAQAVVNQEARGQLRHLLLQESAAICAEVRLESLYSARNLAEYEDVMRWLDDFEFVEPSPSIAEHALETQYRLAKRGKHRLPIADLMIAGAAIESGSTLLHYDQHFDQIAEVSDLEARWIVPRGSGH